MTQECVERASNGHVRAGAASPVKDCGVTPGERAGAGDCGERIPGTIAVVLKGYPRLSETFIAQELHALEGLGLALRLVSLRHPTDTQVHPIHDEIRAPVRYLPEYVYQESARVVGARRRARRLPGYRKARSVFWQDLRRDRTPNRIRRFAQALVLAHELEPDVRLLYAHFLHTPASVARYAAMMRELPWCASAHARDIWTSPDWEKREKLDDASFTVTCTRHNVEHLRALAARPKSVSLVYHGLDLTRFAARAQDERNGGCRNKQESKSVRLLSVGRAVPKKGYAVLLEALAALPPTCHWRLDHIGGGPLLEKLRAQAASLGIAERIHWHGAQAQERVLEHYRNADVFVLASMIADDGDRDGLPNVLMEAQSQCLACVATDVSAVPELIEHDRTGLLVRAGESAPLTQALQRVISEPDLRRSLGRAGEARVREHFSMRGGIDALLEKLVHAVATRSRDA
jgi:glycosyltransferase involved in cell wall biosynthesis